MNTYDEYYPHNYEHTGEEPNFKFNISDRVTYHPFCGNAITGTIDGRMKHSDSSRYDIIYTVECDNGDGRWGYTNQFESI